MISVNRFIRSAINRKAKAITNRNYSTIGRLIPLYPLLKEPNEATIYVKGFLSRGEKLADFSRWKRAHLRRGANWELGSYAYTWQNESFKSHFDHLVPDQFKEIKHRLPSFGERTIPMPVFTIATGASHLAYQFWLRKRLMSPWMFALAGLQDVGLIGSQIYLQYQQARRNAREHAPIFTEQLKELRSNYPEIKIRVVAHSLGSKLALRAVDSTQGLINELHLLAPAITEDELVEVLAHHQNDFPVDNTHIYYSSHDLVLRIFEHLEGQEAIGIHGLSKKLLREHPNIKQLDVTQYLEGINKHKSYGWLFHRFIQSN